MKERFGSRWTAGYINIDRDDMISTFYNRIGIVKERSAADGAGAHCNHVLRISHLVVQSFENGSHFINDGTCNDDDIGLPGSCSCHFKTEPRKIILGRSGAHHFDTATGSSK